MERKSFRKRERERNIFPVFFDGFLCSHEPCLVEVEAVVVRRVVRGGFFHSFLSNKADGKAATWEGVERVRV